MATHKIGELSETKLIGGGVEEAFRGVGANLVQRFVDVADLVLEIKQLKVLGKVSLQYTIREQLASD